MATIYTNRKDGKIVSFKFKVFLGKETSGKHIVKCKTWYSLISISILFLLNSLSSLSG